MEFTPVLRRLSPLASALALVLSGCAVGPEFQRPEAPQASGYTKEALPEDTASSLVAGGDAQRFVQGMDIPGQWWTVFRSSALNALIDRSLKANPTLQSAQAALRVAQENVYAQRGVYYPGVEAGASSTRQQLAGVASSPLNSGAALFNLHTAQVNVAYVPDVFGGFRRQVESLQALADSQRFQLEAAYVSLTSNVVVAAVQEASLRGQIAALGDIIRIENEQLALLRRQLELGAIPEANVIAQEAVLAQTQALLPPLQKQLAQQRDLITALSGSLPSEEPAETFELSMLELPLELPVSLPSKLVKQRPDVRSAEAQLHAASAQIGVARANMLPQITLNANAGNMASELASLFNGANAMWGIAAGLTQPIFQGGTLLHRSRAAEAAFDQAAAQYRSTVITAFQNVADSLRALQYDAEGLKASLAAESAAAQNLQIARRQVELGDVSYLALLTAQQAYQQSIITRVQAQANRYSDTAALFQSLGGGWWNRPELANTAAGGR